MQVNNIISNKSELILGPLEIVPNLFKDERGYFFESFNQKKFDQLTQSKIIFLQDNQSKSFKNVLRGLHYQLEPYGQGKLVRAIKGEIYDVIVDLRENSNTFGQWAGIEINDKKQNQFWIPVGFAHGFITISEIAIIQYKTTKYWSSTHERSLLWSDKKVNIEWDFLKFGLSEPILSHKDSQAETLDKLIDKGEIFK